MSDFMDALVDLLPEHNSLKKPDNPLRRVLDLSVGEWFDRHDILSVYDNLFLMNASGGYLDCHGRDYGVYRQVDESDEAYRTRIVQEKNDNLTPAYLKSVYGLTLYTHVNEFDVNENTLLSDNSYIGSKYISIGDKKLQEILKNKFILDNIIIWLNSDGSIDYIMNNEDIDILEKYVDIYSISKITEFFEDNTSLKKVKLHLPNANLCSEFLKGCTNLVNATLDLPKITTCSSLFKGDTNLEKVVFNMPNYRFNKTLDNLFYGCSKLEYIDATIHSSKVNDLKTYVLGLNLQYLTTFIVNGEEVDLS